MIKCLFCQKEFNPKVQYKQKFCCWQCQEKHNSRRYSRERYEKGIYRKPSKRTLVLSCKKNYIKNKDKWKSRIYAQRFANRNNLSNNCKICGNKGEIHHLEYPTTMQSIKEAFLNNKIFFLCKKHHGKTRRK